MSLESNSDLVPLSACRGYSPADGQLVPWHPLQNHVRPYTPNPSRSLSLLNEPETKPHARFLAPFYSKNQILSELPESAYNSSRRLETPKMNQVGLLIDIYA